MEKSFAYQGAIFSEDVLSDPAHFRQKVTQYGTPELPLNVTLSLRTAEPTVYLAVP